MIIKKKIYWR